MRNMILCGMLLVVGMVAMPAVASDLSVVQDNGKGSLSWHGSGDVLVLHADKANGIRVIEAEPGGVFGLRQGDVILAVNGHPVKRIDGLMEKLRAGKPAPVQLLLRRAGSQQVLTMAASDYSRFLAPQPPTPPSPSTPPTPPTSG